MSKQSVAVSEVSEEVAFGERLRKLLKNKELSAAELTRLIQKRIPQFGAGNISHYLCGRSMPRPQVLKAMGEVLDADLSGYTKRRPDSESGARIPSSTPGAVARGEVPALSITDLGDGNVLLQLNQRLPWALALRILQTIRGSDRSDECNAS